MFVWQEILFTHSSSLSVFPYFVFFFFFFFTPMEHPLLKKKKRSTNWNKPYFVLFTASCFMASVKRSQRLKWPAGSLLGPFKSPLWHHNRLMCHILKCPCLHTLSEKLTKQKKWRMNFSHFQGVHWQASDTHHCWKKERQICIIGDIILKHERNKTFMTRFSLCTDSK